MIDFSGRRPVFRIRGEAQKSGRDEILPMTPDFAEWLQSTFPEAERTGRVFGMVGLDGEPSTPELISETVTTIGRRAGVVVSRKEKTDRKTGKAIEAVKYASCHDLRRSFATRWANRVKPATLQLLMRHADIQTTMKYYVAQDADEVADELWAGYKPATPGKNVENGNTYGNTWQNRATDSEPAKVVNHCGTRKYETKEHAE